MSAHDLPGGIRAASTDTAFEASPSFCLRRFEKQSEFALANLRRLIDVMGDCVQVAHSAGADFGSQRGPRVSPRTYRELYRPFHKQLNTYIHANSNWRTLVHSCGSVFELIPHLVEAGFDILNPIQCFATDMESNRLKREFGRQMVFWSGGVDTQTAMAFGTPQQVHDQTRQRIDALFRWRICL